MQSTMQSTSINAPSHSAMVRVTHWINVVSFFGLLISGIAILIAHPRLYWGETGNVEMPALLNLPLPFVLVGQNGWGRYLHFLSAWICVLNGMVYVLSGMVARHFLQLDESYNRSQRLTYLGVIFVVFPVVIWTGLAMSPAIVSVFPSLVTIWGGQQSARTVHFVLAVAAVVFVLLHIIMVSRSGFVKQVTAMITGRSKS